MWKALIAIFVLLCALAANAQELRGAWIHSPVGIKGWGWDKTVKVLSDNGFNALFANLAWGATADYPSDVLAPDPLAVQKDGTVHDCLQECLDACRKYGVQLHVWIVVCNLGERVPKTLLKQLQEAGRTEKDAEGKETTYLAPQIEENGELLANALKELVAKYEIDGVHLDYIRYPFGACDSSERARKDFEKSLGHEVKAWPADILKGGKHRAEFRQWGRDNITELVRIASRTVRENRPSVQLSAAVYGHWASARDSVCQDAALWVKEGLVDFLCPMNYSGKPEEARGWLKQQLEAVQGRVPIYSGLANYQCETVEALQEEIADARRLGADGFICFQLKPEFAEGYLPVLGKNETAEPSAAPVVNTLKARPKFIWRSHRTLWDRIAFWRSKPVITLTCTAEYKDNAAETSVHIVRNGGICQNEYKCRRRGKTIEISFVPIDDGFYRVRLGDGGDAVHSTTVEFDFQELK
ncbi:MAG: family 10 glycosylhydrolase [Lentisphaeria bacterium]|nr:family 10 glycosylhydrolase [Lentisphaeria bacterium]